jgi:hypothetical protein
MHEPDFLRLFVNRVRKRALDQDFATVNAALRVCEVIVKVCVCVSLALQYSLILILVQAWSYDR